MSTIDHYFKRVSGRPSSSSSSQPRRRPSAGAASGSAGTSSSPSSAPYPLRRPSSSSSPSPSFKLRYKKQAPRSSPHRMSLRAIAKETVGALPGIVAKLENPKLYSASTKLSHDGLGPLDQRECPGHPHPTIRVVNQDTIDTALDMYARAVPRPMENANVVVLNLANAQTPGGGWLAGATAQEEELCFRSSLSLTLHKSQYPMGKREGIYSGDVVVIRTSRADNHELLTALDPADLPRLSVITIAAEYKPRVRALTAAPGQPSRIVFANTADRDLAKDKMRLCLRMAACYRHSRLVLGALGCGVFGNPRQDVADCWYEVLREPEFNSGWWREVCFAVLDKPQPGGNFDVFKKTLAGKNV